MKVEAKKLGPAFCCLFFALSTRPPILYILAEQSDSEARWLLSGFIVVVCGKQNTPFEIVFSNTPNKNASFLKEKTFKISRNFMGIPQSPFFCPKIGYSVSYMKLQL